MGSPSVAAQGVEALAPAGESEQLQYNNPGLVVDLGVGLWAHPLPMDYDQDGDYDLLVSTSDVPSNGLYFFENTAGKDATFPVFKPGVRLAEGKKNLTISYTADGPQVLTPGARYPSFRTNEFEDPEAIPFDPDFPDMKVRANQWKLCDYDGDGVLDLIIGVGDWSDYGWDDAFNAQGEWTQGPLHGYVYVARNTGTNASPEYGGLEKVQAGDGPVDVYGAPSPNFADWDGDGDLDLICGEFLDSLTYFENTGTRTEPEYAPGRPLTLDGEEPLRMELQMLQVVAFDWDADGDQDLVIGQEDGRVALAECTGEVKDGMPVFQAPRFFQQEAKAVKVGALCTPDAEDWDNDGDLDLIVGDTAGFLSFVENLGGNPPKWAAPVRLKAGGEVIRIQAGDNGSIQGPAEAKWGYTVPSVADWNQDGLLDIVINSIRGEVLWYENAGSVYEPALLPAKPVQVAWEGEPPKPAWNWWDPEGNQLVTQWRTTPYAIDWNGDARCDLVMLDHEGYLVLFEQLDREGEPMLAPGKRVFYDSEGNPLRLNEKRAGGSGRRKFTFADWDGDGMVDLLVNSESVDWLRQVSAEPGRHVFEDMGRIDTRRLAGHTTSPTTVDWNRDSIPDLLTGAEDGFLYYLPNPRSGNGN